MAAEICHQAATSEGCIALPDFLVLPRAMVPKNEAEALESTQTRTTTNEK